MEAVGRTQKRREEARRARSGTAAATGASTRRADFTALYRDHHAYVWRILRRMGVPPAGLEDALQDVFIVVHRRRHTLEPDASVRSWLFGIARRVAADVHRGRRRLKRRLEAVPAPPPGPELDDEVARAEAAGFVQTFLERLDEGHRMVFLLADVEGLTAPEIADALELPVGTVRTRLRRAKQLVREALERVQQDRSLVNATLSLLPDPG